MRRDLNKLSESFDLIIIGGGVTGAALTCDAARRGLKVCLIEKNDFGAATSSASSKLLHGGIRYLQLLQFGKVYESADERALLNNMLPHMTEYLPFVVPTSKWSLMKGKLALKIGMILYKIVTLFPDKKICFPWKKLAPSYSFSWKDLVREIPHLRENKNLTGAEVFPESHIYNSERFVLALIKDAVSHGAAVYNYMEVRDFIQEGDLISGVKTCCEFSNQEYEVKGKLVANAAGPFISDLNQRVKKLSLKKRTTGFSKGIHMVTREVSSKYAMALATSKKSEAIISRGGRHFFIIPWRGCSLIGTQDLPFKGDLGSVDVKKDELKGFVEEVNEVFPGIELKEEEVYFAFSGLYPLTAAQIKEDTYQGTGDYQVRDHEKDDGVKGVVSVLGAKYTTARRIAEKAIALIGKKLGKDFSRRVVGNEPIYAGIKQPIESYVKQLKEIEGVDSLNEETLIHLVKSYGLECEDLLKGDLELLGEGRPDIMAQVDFAMKEEMAIHMDDVIMRRTGLGTIGCPSEDLLSRVLERMAQFYSWDEERKTSEMRRLLSFYAYL